MKEKDKINFLTGLKRYIHYKDGFWIYQNDEKSVVMAEEQVREFIRQQGLPILEKDITDILGELSFNKIDFDIDKYFRETILANMGTGKSKYFASMDKLYPGNKFRQIMNYYLFSNECYCFVAVGYGQTGKTTFVDLIAEILRECFFGRANVALLRNSHGTAVLEGKMFFEVAEAQDLDLDTANLLKSIITKNLIFINPKFQLPRTFKPHTKLMMTCNNMPKFKVTDDGVIRRFIPIKMNNKIKVQNENFIQEMKDDIPNIIKEAYENPFNIEDFADEQYYIFESDPQWGFGYGIPNRNYDGVDDYERYRAMCKALGFMPRNKANFDKFIELANIYGGRRKCDTTSSGSLEKNGTIQLLGSDIDNPFF